jgi:hypothetical protein
MIRDSIKRPDNRSERTQINRISCSDPDALFRSVTGTQIVTTGGEKAAPRALPRLLVRSAFGRLLLVQQNQAPRLHAKRSGFTQITVIKRTCSGLSDAHLLTNLVPSRDGTGKTNSKQMVNCTVQVYKPDFLQVNYT